MSQPLPSGPLPEEADLQQKVSEIVDEVGPANLTFKVLRLRLEGRYQISFADQKQLLEKLVVDKLSQPATQRQLAKVRKEKTEGAINPGKGKRKGKKVADPAGKKHRGESKVKKEKHPKEKKDQKPEGYPRKPISAFFFFGQAKRPELKDLPGGVAAIGKRLGEMWGEITAEEKATFEAQAEADKERYKQELEAYIAKGGVLQTAERKAGKKAAREKEKSNHPKKPKTAYFAFADEKRAELIAAEPELKSKVTEMSKRIGELWNSCEDKTKYNELAAQDRVRYEKECAEMGIVPKQPAPKKMKKTKAPASDDSSADSDSSSSSSGSASSSSGSASSSSSSSSSDSSSDSE